MVVAIAVIATLLYLIFVRWQKGLHAFSMAFFISGFIPLGLASFTYITTGNPIIEPHWFYFSSLGFFLLLASGILTLRKWVRSTGWILIVFCILVTGLLMVRHSNTHWKDQETYCRYWLSINGGDWTPYWGMGRSLLEKGHYQGAVSYFEEGLYVNRYSPRILADLGYAYFKVGDYDAGVQACRAALRLDPTYSVAYHYMGQIFLATRAYREAKIAFSNAFRLNPWSVSSYRYLLAVNNMH